MTESLDSVAGVEILQEQSWFKKHTSSLRQYILQYYVKYSFYHQNVPPLVGHMNSLNCEEVPRSPSLKRTDFLPTSGSTFKTVWGQLFNCVVYISDAGWHIRSIFEDYWFVVAAGMTAERPAYTENVDRRGYLVDLKVDFTLDKHTSLQPEIMTYMRIISISSKSTLRPQEVGKTLFL